MKKLKMVLYSLCLVILLTMALPTSVLADDSGPQGGANSTKSAPPPPPPPPPSGGGLVGLLIGLLYG